MKTSNKIILISLAALGGLVLILGVASRIVIGGATREQAREDLTVRTEQLRDFTAIEVNAVWDLRITRGDTYAVVITGDKAAEAGMIVRRDGQTLILDRRRSAFRARGAGALRADITMPEITSLDFSGVGSVTITGFTGHRFRLSSSGAGAVICRDSSFEELSVALSGVGGVDFSAAGTKNAVVELSGLGSLKLHMTGGELSGDLSGLGSIEYSGEVSAERVNKSGLGAVERK